MKLNKKKNNIDSEFDKDFPDRDLDKEKKDFINKIKTIKKDEIFQTKKYSIWTKIKKSLGL